MKMHSLLFALCFAAFGLLFQRSAAAAPGFEKLPGQQGKTSPLVIRIVHYAGSSNGVITVEVKNPTDNRRSSRPKGSTSSRRGTRTRRLSGWAPSGLRQSAEGKRPAGQRRDQHDDRGRRDRADDAGRLLHRFAPRQPQLVDVFRIAKDRVPEPLMQAIDHDTTRAAAATAASRPAAKGAFSPRSGRTATRSGSSWTAKARRKRTSSSLHQRAVAVLDPERHRAVVHQIDGHVGAEAARLDGEAGGAQDLGDAQVQRFSAPRLAAGSKLGRLPLPSAAQSVNWLTTRQAPATSATVTSIGVRPGKMRSAATLRAVASASASPSPFSTPTNSRRPRSMRPTRSPPTRTSARVTRWTTVFTGAVEAGARRRSSSTVTIHPCDSPVR